MSERDMTRGDIPSGEWMNEAGPPYDDGYRQGISYGLWCAGIFGFAGLHRIYLGKYGTGILWFLTFGLLGVGQLIDLFRMRTLISDANIREGYALHPRTAHQMLLQQQAKRPASLGKTEKPLRFRLLDAAMVRGGAISVTEGVAATGADFEQVEETLRNLVSGGYVDVDNAPGSGVVIYRFTEFGSNPAS